MSNEEEMNQLEDADVIALAEKVLEEQRKQEQKRNELLDYLGRDITGKLHKRMGLRKVKEAQWLEAARLYLGSLASFEFFTSDYAFGENQKKIEDKKPEVNIVRVKCDAAISQTMAYQFAAGDKNWDINPPTVIDIDPADVQATANQQQRPMRPEEVVAYRANLMSKEIEYHLGCTRYAQEARMAMRDRVILGTGILKLPGNSGKLKKTYIRTTTREGTVVRVPSFTLEKVPQIYRVNPWYFFPQEGATTIGESEGTIEIHPKTKTELREFLQRPDFYKDKIEEVLAEEPREFPASPFNDPAFLTQGTNIMKDKYIVIEYHGPITKEMLTTLQMCGCDEEVDEQFGEIWVINQKVVKLELSNLEGRNTAPYCTCVWEPDPATLFGYGIPMLTRDQQRVVNESYKMMLDNAGVSAGPQVIIDTTLIQPLDGGLECTPFKVWIANEYGTDTTKAIQFFTPPNSFDGLSNLFQLAKQLADEESSIPLLLSGLSTPTGASDNATSMALMNQNATSPLFYKSEQWDDDMTHPLITAVYDWEMQFNPKDEIKGSYDIDVRTSTSYLRNSMDNQKIQALRQEIAQGSPIGEWINQDELAIVSLTGMRLPYKGLIKSPEQVAEERANAPEPPPDPNLIKAQNDQQRVELERMRLQLDAQIAQVEAQNAQQLAEIQAQVQAQTNETRQREAEASVIKAQFDFQAAMAALASKDEIDRTKILATIQSDQMDAQTKMFLAGQQAQATKVQQAQKDRQLDIQEKQANARSNRQ